MIAALFGLAGYFHLFPGAEIFTRYDRIKGTFQDPNVFGPFMVLPIVFLFQDILNHRLSRSIGKAFLLLLMLLAVFLAFSRAAWGMTAFAVLIVAVLAYLNQPGAAARLRIIGYFGMAVVLVAVLLIAVLSIPAVSDLFQQRAELVEDYDAGALGRFGRHVLGFFLVQEHPLGIGPLVFSRLFGEDEHNMWLKGFTTYGWLGGFAYIVLVLWTIVASARLLFRPRPWQPLLHCIFAVYLGQVMIHNVIDNDHWRHLFMIYGLLWGLVAAEKAYAAASARYPRLVPADARARTPSLHSLQFKPNSRELRARFSARPRLVANCGSHPETGRTSTMRSPSIKSGHGRVEALDILRLFAALSVVAFHYSFRGAGADNMTWLSLPALIPVTKYGFLGVQLFFVISGFVIAYSAEGRNAREFVVARVARIYPGFLACMTLTFVITLAFGAPRFQTSITQWLANLAIVAPALKQPFMDGVYWSIVYELVFYAWTTVIIAGGLFPRRLPLIVVVWLAISMANELILSSNAVRRLLVTDASGFFAAGLLLYALYSGRRGAAVWLLLAAATLVGALQANGDADWVRNHFAIALSPLSVMIISVAAVALVGGCLLLRRLPLPANILLAAGGLTYPLYLLHQMLGFIAFNRLQGVASPPILVLATLAVIVVLSWAIYRYVERPGQRAIRTMVGQILRVPPRPGTPASVVRGEHDIPIFGPVALPRAALAVPTEIGRP